MKNKSFIVGKATKQHEVSTFTSTNKMSFDENSNSNKSS